jgi:8-oxo-dGTP pyrophosphatase MutT (NUDIX family)
MVNEKSCGAVVVKKDNGEIKFLLIKQHDEYWHFPKGHVEDEETEIDTAIREIKEETNIDVEIDSDFRKVISYSPKKGVMKDVVFFIGKAISFDLKIDPKELLDAKWVNPDEVKDYLNYQDTIWVFEEAVNYLRETGQLL